MHDNTAPRKNKPPPVTVTIFPNRFAKSKTEQLLTLDELRAFVLSNKKRKKDRLPLIKLARFGDQPNDNNCLRYDDNVNIVYGIELDYDRELIAFDKFVRKLRKVKVKALIYTSPSCTPTRPRVRIILPFKNPLRARLKRRAAFVSQIDGLFGGNVFGSESWKLSQTYYVGHDLSNIDADFRAVVIEGDYIDGRSDLQRFEAVSTKARQIKVSAEKRLSAQGAVLPKADRNPFQRFGDEMSVSVGDALASMDYRERHGGKGVHHSQRDVTYQLLKHGWPDEEAIALVLTATFALPVAVKWNRNKEIKKIEKLCVGAHRRLAQEKEELLTLPCANKRAVATMDQQRQRQRQHLARAFESHPG